VEATIADYFHMLTLELSGQQYNKADHRRALWQKLDDRTNGAIELKHQNISAILLELGYPWISGYKPMKNYQALLFGTRLLQSRSSKCVAWFGWRGICVGLRAMASCKGGIPVLKTVHEPNLSNSIWITAWKNVYSVESCIGSGRMKTLVIAHKSFIVECAIDCRCPHNSLD
jgi:hypothetical protein